MDPLVAVGSLPWVAGLRLGPLGHRQEHPRMVLVDSICPAGHAAHAHHHTRLLCQKMDKRWFKQAGKGGRTPSRLVHPWFSGWETCFTQLVSLQRFSYQRDMGESAVDGQRECRGTRVCQCTQCTSAPTSPPNRCGKGKAPSGILYP